MLKKISVCLVLSLIVSLLSSLVGTDSGKVSASAQPLLPNPENSFWKFESYGGGDVEYSVVSDVYHSAAGQPGDHSLHVTNRTPLTPNVFTLAYQKVPVKPNTTYDLSLWVKGENVRGVSGPNFAIPDGIYDWQQIKASYTTGPQEHIYRYSIIVEDITDNVWLDDLSMTESGSSRNLPRNGSFEKQLQPVLVDGFENQDLWRGSQSLAGTAEAVQVTDRKNEGAYSEKLSFKMNAGGSPGYISSYWSPLQNLDLSGASTLLLDVYAESQTSHAIEPLIIKIYNASGGIVYESAITQLTSNQWNTVSVDLSDYLSLRNQVQSIEFYVYSGSESIEGRTEISYWIDNLRMLTMPAVQPVQASQGSGVVPAGTEVQLFAADDAIIYYTTDGSDPRVSITRAAYNQPIRIERSMVIKAYAEGDVGDASVVSEFAYEIGTGIPGESLIDVSDLMGSLGKSKYVPLFHADADLHLDGTWAGWEGYASLSLPADPSQILIDGWAGQEDLSATARFAYDEEALYVGVEVKDDTHEAYAGNEIWKGDSVQMAFSPDGEHYGPEYGFSHANGSSQVWRWNDGTAVLEASSVQLVSSQNGNVTTYQAKIPWGAIGANGKPANSLSFTFLVNDNDGNGRRGWIEWTGGIGKFKDPAQFGSFGLIPKGDQWHTRVEGKTVLSSGETQSYHYYITNFSENPIELRVNSPSLEWDRLLELPAGTMLKKSFDLRFSDIGKKDIAIQVSDPATGKIREDLLQLVVTPSKADLHARFDQLAARMPGLDQLLADAKARRIPTDYEQINASVIRKFLTYGKDDADHNMQERSIYVAEQLEALYDEAVDRLQGYLNGTLSARTVPRYKTGVERPSIQGRSFIAETTEAGTDQPNKSKVFFTGYGHFNQVRKDVAEFEDLGTNIIQIEIGPNSIIKPSIWEIIRASGVQGNIQFDANVKHSGDASMKLTNQSVMTPQVYLAVKQGVTVQPNTSYKFEAWVKGEDVNQVWFLGGASWLSRHAFPNGTYDWQKVTAEYTTGPDETWLEFLILSEDRTGSLWVDDISMTAEGSVVNMLDDPGFEESTNTEVTDKGYTVSTSAIRNDVQKVLQEASDHNVAVNLLLSPHYFPDFALAKWPELKSNNPHFLKFNLDSPKAKEIMSDYLKTIIPMVKDYPSLHSVTISNEAAYESNRDSQHLPKWHAYLRQLYDEKIEKLNALYGTSYESFDQVPMPSSYTPSVYYYDWTKFNNDLFSGWHRWMVDIIQGIAPELPVQVKIMGETLTAVPDMSWGVGVDLEQFGEFTQINGNDNNNLLGKGPDGFLRELKFYDLQSSLKAAPGLNSEDHIIADRDERYDSRQADHTRTVLWQGAMHGLSGAALWVWERSYDKNSDFYGSLLHRPDVVSTVGKTNLDLNRLANEVSAFQDDEPKVHILYSLPSTVYAAPTYMDALYRAYKAASYSGQKVGFMSEKQIREDGLGSTSVLIVPQATHVEASTLQGIHQYAAGGGTVLLMGDDSLQYDDRKQPQNAQLHLELLDNSTVLPADVSAIAMRDQLFDIYEQLNLDQVLLIDRDTDKPVMDVEWRSVLQDGKRLINIANYTEDVKKISIMINGQPAGELTDLLGGANYDASAMDLQLLRPYLLETESPSAYSRIEWDAESYTLEVGSSLQLKLYAIDRNGIRHAISTGAEFSTFTSAHPEIASVDSTGKLTALKEGETVITAKFKSFEATAKVTVQRANPGDGGSGWIPPVALPGIKGIQFDATPSRIKPGDARKLTVRALYENGKSEQLTAKAVFTSSHPDVVSVDAEGNIIGRLIGTATITAKYDSLTATVAVQVVDGSKLQQQSKRFEANQAGELKLGSQLVVRIPEGASAKPMTVTATIIDNPGGNAASGLLLASPVFEIVKEPADDFAKPITLELMIDSDKQGYEESAVYFFDKLKQGWVKLEGQTTGRTITVQVTSAGVFAIFAAKPADAAQIEFKDTVNHWARNAIAEAAALGIVKGTGEGTFRPNDLVTRAEFAAMLGRALQWEAEDAEAVFTDPIPSWAVGYVTAGAKLGIISGYTNQTFGAKQQISRTEMTAMIVRALKLPLDAGAEPPFKDANQTAKWAKPYVSAAANANLIRGKGGQLFAPQDKTTRAEAVTVIMNMLNMLENK
ncbi:S-layer homology domain-containing protein [Paenibacillus nasutitermitis]|uniref:SLH domain-containing protein n=1 Tax=Paenibacillus nasutitermitis TaxID=1652958 RepID=A0A916ZKC4_9BACL|nr:S-layer homology domain-containing protein [Paenibacillus nasutitermitis]GGE01430.1 hypothetical protein GCM10010911_70380 [Paenibacillus nasutitermitis]